MDQPSLQTSLLSVRASYARCSSFPQARREALVAIWGSVLQVRLCQKDFGLPAGQTILNAIGNLLAYGCQLE
jgi:hypothetical protein